MFEKCTRVLHNSVIRSNWDFIEIEEYLLLNAYDSFIMEWWENWNDGAFVWQRYLWKFSIVIFEKILRPSELMVFKFFRFK